MKKYLKVMILILAIIFVLTIVGIIICKYMVKEEIVSHKEELYEKVEQYLISMEQPHYLKPNILHQIIILVILKHLQI